MVKLYPWSAPGFGTADGEELYYIWNFMVPSAFEGSLTRAALWRMFLFPALRDLLFPSACLQNQDHE